MSNDLQQISRNVLWIRNWRRCCICAGQTLRVHSPGGSTVLYEVMSWPPSNRKSDSVYRGYLLEEQSCQISSRSDLKRLGFWRGRKNNKNNNKNKTSTDMKSVPDPQSTLYGICTAFSCWYLYSIDHTGLFLNYTRFKTDYFTQYEK